ncbi:hypothetical protein JXB11_00170, partial [Candidatus Woesearchaeota archaeon]|nr:hypothetical protein [Candidatus Woesearchaeota archaeon]
MSAPPKARGMIFADLHNHICTHLHPLESIADKLASGKITGLSEREDLGHIFTYDSALELLPSIGAKVEEVDSGLFAVIEWKGQKGYIARTKEFTYDHHHLLSLGVKDLNDDHDAEYTIKAIQDKGGVAILDHPYVLIPRRSEKFRFVVPGSADESGLDKFFEIVDEA